MDITTMLSKIKRLVSEPKVYALMVESAHGQVLHLGVHFSLEEAYSAARMRMESLSPHNPGEAMDIDLWNMLPARQVMAQLIDPVNFNETSLPEGSPKAPVDNTLGAPVFTTHGITGNINQLPAILQKILSDDPNSVRPLVDSTIKDHVQVVKEKKNGLMQKLIQEGDVEQVGKLDMLTSREKRYVLKKISDKKDLPENK